SGSCRGCRSSRSRFTVPPSRASTTDMCRLFGLTAGPHRVHAHFWLLDAPDSIVAQSHRNPDGTGLAYYEPDEQPVLDKEPLAAFDDSSFSKEARHVSSQTFVVHVRHASTG